MTPGAEDSARRARPLLLALMFVGVAAGGLVACGQDSAEITAGTTTPPQSKPVGEGARPTVEVAPRSLEMNPASPVAQPVGLGDLRKRLPAMTDLSLDAQRTVEACLNLQPAPCEPCMEHAASLATCLDPLPAGCENVPELAARAVRLAAAGVPDGVIRSALVYPESWTASPQLASPGWPQADAAVHVELWLDPTRGQWREAVSRTQALVERSRSDATVGPISVHVRLLPTWALRDQDPPLQAQALHAAVAAADHLGAGLPFVTTLALADPDAPPDLEAAAVAAGLDLLAWKAARNAAAPRLAQDLGAARDITLRSAPSYRIDGYRLRGLRTLENLIDMVENQQLDHLADVPPEMLTLAPPAAP